MKLLLGNKMRVCFISLTDLQSCCIGDLNPDANFPYLRQYQHSKAIINSQAKMFQHI